MNCPDDAYRNKHNYYTKRPIHLGPVHMIPLTGTSRLPMISFEFAEIIGRRDENFSI
jgi:hypothetical protein